MYVLLMTDCSRHEYTRTIDFGRQAFNDDILHLETCTTAILLSSCRLKNATASAIEQRHIKNHRKPGSSSYRLHTHTFNEEPA